METPALPSAFLPSSHHGAWSGPNRLWIMDPTAPSRSTGAMTATGVSLRYSWAHEGAAHAGSIDLKGQPAAMQAIWRDSFHAKDPITLHGCTDAGVIRLYTTYDAGDESWGWQIELDARDPESLVMRMFNVMPGLGAVPAVVLHGSR